MTAGTAASAPHPRTTRFADALPYRLDPFQQAACHALEDGDSVLVAAPTGAGKTVVADFAVELALGTTDGRVFYTTPVKALSNQKHRDLVAAYGADAVGLLTGDVSVNPDARIVVMTTEVLRNMLYADDDATRALRYVVLDEVHYLGDRLRGAVWEEVIIHLPARVRLVCLSATVSNAEEFGDWLHLIRSGSQTIVSEHRPVPLRRQVLARHRLLPLFRDDEAARPRVNPELQRAVAGRPSRDGRGRQRGRRPAGDLRRGARTDRAEAIRLLGADGLLPAIFFIFSRAGCDAAFAQTVRSGVTLTTPDQRAQIRAVAQERVAAVSPDDLDAVGYRTWLAGVRCGVAAHHAGMLPVFKEIVEELFLRRLVTVVFATETLALGVNMPARTVVLERLQKFNGVARVPVTPGEFTQLTGRAGRRGIDDVGHAVVVADTEEDVQAAASLASRRTFPLRSSFRPTYNMAVNLIDRLGRDTARTVLRSSFAQFQADRAVADLARRVRELEETLEGYRAAMRCSRGDFADYARLRQALTDVERRKAPAADPAARDERQRRIRTLRDELHRHPCHACPDRETHARWAERHHRRRREADRARRQIDDRTRALLRRFDRVVDVLHDEGYLRRDDDGQVALTDAGLTLRRVYTERDLLVAESLRLGLWDELDGPDLAGLVCALVYEPRRSAAGAAVQRVPRGALGAALQRTALLWARLDDMERAHGLDGTEPLAPGLSQSMRAWARGGPLADVLETAGITAGDFVRCAKQTIDLLDQLAAVGTSELAHTARDARDAVRRGIVAYGTV